MFDWIRNTLVDFGKMKEDIRRCFFITKENLLERYSRMQNIILRAKSHAEQKQLIAEQVMVSSYGRDLFRNLWSF